MGLVYADTSALFAYFYPKDDFSLIVTEAARRHSPDFVYWPFIRYELRHNLRQWRIDSTGETGWKALRAAEKTRARLQWQPTLRTESLLEAADELSAQLATSFTPSSADFLHVCAARRLHLELRVEAFWTCDAEQAKLAKAVGLNVRTFKLA